MKKFCIFYTFVIITTTFSHVFANKNVFKIDIKQNIGSTSWLYIRQGFAEAQQNKADMILIHMNTYGGEVLYADSIRTKILNSAIPVTVFVDNNAASAGALIAIACDKIYMRPGASIGAATVVNESGQRMPDKYQSYMRATMRATAEAHGKDTIVNGNDTVYQWKRNPLIAEAMVDDRTVIPGVIDSGKTLTFTAQEAVKYHYCDGIAENTDEVIQQELKTDQYDVSSFSANGWIKIKGFLMSSIIQGILIMLIIGGIYFELQTPGVGFPLIVAITAAVLYFAPLYIDGLAANWEILIFFIGIVLIGLEIFVVPGFGITGISGIILVIAGLTLSLLNNVDFNFDKVQTGNVNKALLTVIGGITLSFALILYLSNKIGSRGAFKKMALEKTLKSTDGYVGVPVEQISIVGQTGTALTVLRLSGKIKVNSKVYDAVSEDGFIEQGTKVKVIRYEASQLYVVKADTY